MVEIKTKRKDNDHNHVHYIYIVFSVNKNRIIPFCRSMGRSLLINGSWSFNGHSMVISIDLTDSMRSTV